MPLLTSLVWLLVGSYQPATSQVIQLFTFDPETGNVTYVGGAEGVSNPSFLTISSDRRFVYAVGEDDGLTSTANALSLDLASGTLRLLNSQLAQGGAPCNLCLSPDGQQLFTANYNGGSITQFPILADGTLGDGTPFPFAGSSINPERQSQPHLHAVNFTPDGNYLLANDLGTDRIHQFAVAPDGTLDYSSLKDIELPAGAGPRHLTFAPDGRHAYLISELSGQLFTFAYSDGQLTLQQAVNADQFQAGGSADVHISPDGQFLYASHRLRGDGLTIWRIQADGALAYVGYQPTGIHPRNFALSPDGKFLLVACRDSNHIEFYLRDPLTGLLSDTGQRLSFSAPVFVTFVSDSSASSKE